MPCILTLAKLLFFGARASVRVETLTAAIATLCALAASFFCSWHFPVALCDASSYPVQIAANVLFVLFCRADRNREVGRREVGRRVRAVHLTELLALSSIEDHRRNFPLPIPPEAKP